MKLITKEDFSSITGAAKNISDKIWDAAYNVIIDTQAGALLSEALRDAILALDHEDSSTDLLTEKYAFWRDYVKKWAAWAVYCEIAAVHGLNWSTHGITKFVDRANTAESIGKDERQSLLRQAESNREAYRTKILRRLNDINWTLDGSEYSKEDHFSSNQGRSVVRLGAPFRRRDDYRRSKYRL